MVNNFFLSVIEFKNKELWSKSRVRFSIIIFLLRQINGDFIEQILLKWQHFKSRS